MIAYLKWQILSINSSQILILTNSWVWYEVIINELYYSQIWTQNNIELFIYNHITENSAYLFWFLNLEQREIFKELIKISWIWWKVAMSILSLGLDRLSQAIIDDNREEICQIKWIWKKMASKIVLELKDKDFIQILWNSKKNSKKNQNENIPNDIKQKVLESLINMWYTKKNILDAMNELPEEKTDIWEIIPFLVKKM